MRGKEGNIDGHDINTITVRIEKPAWVDIISGMLLLIDNTIMSKVKNEYFCSIYLIHTVLRIEIP